jgi:hypothetical protein
VLPLAGCPALLEFQKRFEAVQDRQESLQLRPIDSKHKRHFNCDLMRVFVWRRWRKACKDFFGCAQGRLYLCHAPHAGRIKILPPSEEAGMRQGNRGYEFGGVHKSQIASMIDAKR